MNELTNYTILTAVSLTGFYLIYKVLFSNGHRFQFLRILILSALVLSFIFPFIQIDFSTPVLKPFNVFDMTLYFPAATVGNSTVIEDKGLISFDYWQLVVLIYCFGSFLFALRYIIKLFSIYKLIHQHEVKKKNKYFYVKLKEGNPTFSFRNYIFSSQQLDKENEAMFVHEQCHVDQKHTYDLLLVELLLIMQWFNPFIHLFKRRLVEIHEFLADEKVLQCGYNKSHYQVLLLTSLGKNSGYEFTSSFGSNFKKRLIMMNRNKSIQVKAWKLSFPMLFGCLIILINSCQENGPGDTLAGTVVNANTNADGDIQLSPPIDKRDMHKIGSGYGMAYHPILKVERMHRGIDYPANEGTAIYTAAPGTVRTAGLDGAYGQKIIVDHKNGFSTLYAHMSEIVVEKGNNVKSGQLIGRVGNTGLSSAPHLHFELMKDGEHVNPEDYLK